MKMKLLKIVKKTDADVDLWWICRELNDKYRTKYDPIDLYMHEDDKNNSIAIGINWPSIGRSDMATTKGFAKKLLDAVKFADKIEAEIKKKYPNVKVTK